MSIALPPDREWLTAPEAAVEQLPGFGLTARHIQRLIKDGEIATRKRSGRGGGREFHWTSLPAEARAEYLKRYGIEREDIDRNETPLVKAARRNHRADARAEIVKAAQSFIADFHMPVGKGLQTFCKRYTKGRTKVPAWAAKSEPALAPHMIRRWQRALGEGGTDALLDRRGRPAGSGLIHDDAQLSAYIKSQYAARPQLTARHLCDAVAADLQRTVALRTMQSFLASFRQDHAPVLKALTNPDKDRSHHQPAYGCRSAAITRINQRWEIDGTVADAVCITPDGREIRFKLVALIDVFTRRAMVLVTEQPRAVATQALLRRAIIAWGLPELLKADNGKDFTARAVVNFCQTLGIELSLSTPFSPEQKPHIERFFGALNRGLFPTLDGFVGHDVAQRQAIRSRQSYAHRFGEEARLAFEVSLTPHQLQARIDAWLGDSYEQTIHGGLQQTPANMALAFADQVRQVEDQRVLDMLLMDAPDASGIRVVLKKGIRVGSRYYIALEIAALSGYRVHVRIDPTDLSRIVVYTAESNQFVAIAECTEGMAAERQIKIATEAKSVRRGALRLIRTEIADARRAHPTTGLGDRLLHDAAGDGFVLADDAREAMHTAARPRLVAASQAADAIAQSKSGPQPQEPTADQLEAAAAYVSDMTARLPAPPRLVECDGYQRPDFLDDDLGFWTWAQARRSAGEPLDQVDTTIFAELAASPAFQQQLANARAGGANG